MFQRNLMPLVSSSGLEMSEARPLYSSRFLLLFLGIRLFAGFYQSNHQIRIDLPKQSIPRLKNPKEAQSLYFMNEKGWLYQID